MTKRQLAGRWLLGISTAALVLLGFERVSMAQDQVGTRATGMGGALRAAATGESAVLLNPAGMTLLRTYVINGSYQYRGSDTGSFVNVSVVDSISKRLAAGLYYSFVHLSPRYHLPIPSGVPNGEPRLVEETITGHEVGLALAYPLGESIHLGVNTKYVNVDCTQPAGLPEGAQRFGNAGLSVDVGAIVKPIPQLNVAVVGHNLANLELERYPRSLGMGLAFAIESNFLAEFDTVLDFATAEVVKPSYHGGLELFLGGRYALRGGVEHDTATETTSATGGLGLITPKIALDFGLRQMVAGGAATVLSFSLRLFLEQAGSTGI